MTNDQSSPGACSQQAGGARDGPTKVGPYKGNTGGGGVRAPPSGEVGGEAGGGLGAGAAVEAGKDVGDVHLHGANGEAE
jgi:hypothetical protein